MGEARDRTFRRLGTLTFAVATAAALAVVTPSVASAHGGDIHVQVLGAGSPNAIPGSYIVVFKDGRTSSQTMTAKYGGQVKSVWSDALHGYSARMSQHEAEHLAADPAVAFVEQDQTFSLLATQTPVPSWGLDRIDQRNLPLNNTYNWTPNGTGVTAYIIDTGVRVTHTTFGGRASFNFNAVGDGINTDCNGHGTHVAGTVGGSQYGVAKNVRIVAIKVLSCSGSGTTTQVVNGINRVAQLHAAGASAVANMSLGGGPSTAIDNAVRAAIADGVTFAIASGNSNANACNFSPARVTQAITVNATDRPDNRASFSNFGTCTDIFAPGVGITSAWMTSDTATNTISGTSMATPHVAGAAALYLQGHPTASPATVQSALIANATSGVVTSPGSGSPNRLLFTIGL
jgi:subtilisin family serine protease